MMKVTQNEDGTPGTVTRVAGNCVRGVPVSGQLATSTPFTNQSDNPWNNNIVVWGNGRYIYYNEGGLNSGRTFKIIDGISYTSSVVIGSGSSAVYNPAESLIYVADNSVRAYSVNLSGNSGEVQDLTKRLDGAGTGGNCTEDGIPGTDACGLFSSGVISSSGRFFFVEGVTGLVRLRYLDDNSNIQTIAGTKPFSGDGKAPSLAKGNFSGIYYKKSTELLSSTYPEGLYFLENQGGVFGYFTDSTTNHLWGNQSAKTFSGTGTVISKDATIGSLSNISYGALSSLTFDRLGQPWIRSNSHGLYYLDSTKTIRSPSTAVISDSSKSWHLAPAGGNPSLYHVGAFGTIQNMTFKDDSKLFLLGVFYDSATGWTDLKGKLRIFDYENSTVKHVMGDQTPASAPQQLTPGSLQNSPLFNCFNVNCSILYSQSNDRLYFTENSTKLRYITDPETPANHTLVDVFTAIGTITNFTISPSGKYIMYTMSGRLYCHAVNLVDESAICKNNPANHINLGPPAGLSLITRGPNQFTWKSETILYVSTYTGEIYEYLLFH